MGIGTRTVTQKCPKWQRESDQEVFRNPCSKEEKVPHTHTQNLNVLSFFKDLICSFGRERAHARGGGAEEEEEADSPLSREHTLDSIPGPRIMT